jgi:hypothetical protein
MNKGLKWILIGLGIALMVFIVAVFAINGFAFRPLVMIGRRALGLHHPFSGVMFGMGLFMILRVLFGAAVIGFAIFGIVSLFRGYKSMPVKSTPSIAVESQAAPLTVEQQRTCVKCSKPLQTDWTNCPYCGKKQ